jgi:hypothetical protein
MCGTRSTFSNYDSVVDDLVRLCRKLVIGANLLLHCEVIKKMFFVVESLNNLWVIRSAKCQLNAIDDTTTECCATEYFGDGQAHVLQNKQSNATS